MRILIKLSDWLWGAIRLPGRQIRWRIIAPYVLLTIILAVSGTYLATRIVTGSLEERFDSHLGETARVMADSVVRRERQHLELIRSVAFTQGVGAATEAGDRDELATFVGPLAANAGAELVEVLDADGRRILGLRLSDPSKFLYEELEDAGDRGAWTSVRAILEGESDSLGDKFAQIIETTAGYALYTAGPIYDGDRLVGIVLVGSLLESFLPIAKTAALGDITIYDFDGSPLASTFPDGDSEEADLVPAAAVLAEIGAPYAIRERKSLFGRDFDLLYGELTVRDQVVGVYSVALPSSFITGATVGTTLRMGLLFGIATAAVLISGLFLARTITRPLLKLVKAAQTLSSGDLTARSEVDSADELGTLATTFDYMADRIQRQHLSTIKALTSAIDARDPYTLGHSIRVGQLAVEIGSGMGLAESELQHLEIGGYLHDIGKIGVRDNVLLKPGALTSEERALVEEHPRIGLDIVSAVELAPEVLEFIAGHHEKLNGGGYPYKIGAELLTLYPRIGAVSDIFDALTTDRPYRAAFPTGDAVDMLRRMAVDGELDSAVVAELERALPRWAERLRTDTSLKGFELTTRQAEVA